MELSERCIQTLEKEGFISVYECSDAPSLVYAEHQHDEKVALIVTEGTLLVKMSGQTKELLPGDRIDIPAHTLHSGVVGPQGCQYVVGEM